MPSTAPMPKESAKLYSYFCDYRDMGPDRTIEKVCKKRKKSVSFISKLSVRFNWLDRVKEYAAEQNELRRQAELKVLEEEQRELAHRRKQVREDAWTTYQELLVTARSHLRLVDAKKRPLGGKPVDAARLARAAEIMGRIGADMPIVTRAEITGAGGKPLIPLVAPIIKIDYLSEVESKKLLAEAREGIRKRED